MTDHDRLFKELLSTFFLEFLDLFRPEVGKYIERGSIVFLDKEVLPTSRLVAVTRLTWLSKHDFTIAIRSSSST